MSNNEHKKPIIYLVLRILGFTLLAVGIILFISAITTHVPDMGQDNWFEASTRRMQLFFGGSACLMFAFTFIIASFTPNFKNIAIKTQ